MKTRGLRCAEVEIAPKNGFKMSIKAIFNRSKRMAQLTFFVPIHFTNNNVFLLQTNLRNCLSHN